MNRLLFLAYAACIPAANWMIGNVGTTCIPEGPCVIPVWPGLLAPSGVVMIGLALVLRDLVQFRMGAWWSLGAIGLGTMLSLLVAPASLATASALAFLVSELADFGVYTPLQRRGLVTAVAASSTVGLVVDSALFLWLAFGTLEHLAGQLLGKLWMVAAATAVLALIRSRHRPGDWLFLVVMMPVLLVLGLIDDEDLDGTGEEP